MLGVASIGEGSHALHSVDEGGSRDVVRLRSASDRHILSRTDCFDSKVDSTFLGLCRHGVVVGELRVKVEEVATRGKSGPSAYMAQVLINHVKV